MNEQRTQGEPSMEEILASIRKIISEDETSPKEDDADSEFGVEIGDPVPEPEPEPDDAPVLDLENLAVPEEDEDDVLELTEVYETEEPRVVVAETLSEPLPEEPPLPPIDEHLLSNRTAQMAQGAFARLSDTGPSLTSEMTFASGQTVEGMVREMLRPMLQQWLDENLPTIVERIVEREVEYVGRGGGRR